MRARRVDRGHSSPSEADEITSFTVLNMHELAVTSGFAAAYRLGADYPFHGDEDCERLFRLYLGLSHGARMVRWLRRPRLHGGVLTLSAEEGGQGGGSRLEG